MRKLIFLILFLIFYASFSRSENVPVSIAQNVAYNVFYQYNNFNATVNYNDIITENIIPVRNDTTLVYYIFNLGLKDRTELGFVIVSADDNATPVPAYSFEGNYPAGKEPSDIKFWMDLFSQKILYVKEHKIIPQPQVIKEWIKLKSLKSYYLLPQTVTVGPLLTSKWGQDCYYNLLCPDDNKADNGYCGHVPTGCVATAMSQIMNYWNFPVNGTGTNSYSSAYGNLSADFSSAGFSWSDMPVSLSAQSSSAQKNAVASLMLSTGIAVNMQYNINGSNAYSSAIPTAFVNFYNYSTDVKRVIRSDYLVSDWESLMRSQIDAGMPLLYAAVDPSNGGHAFVCDGYQDNVNFHINWGWDGLYNGYFNLSFLQPDSHTNFSSQQEATINIHPGINIKGPEITHAYQQNCSYSLDYYSPYNIQWSVDGGEIASGQGTGNILVNWYREGSRQVNLQLNFDKKSNKNKLISFSKNVKVNDDTIIFYPGPNRSWNILLNSLANGALSVNLYNEVGKKLEALSYNKNSKNFYTKITLPNIARELIFVEILFNNKRFIRKMSLIN